MSSILGQVAEELSSVLRKGISVDGLRIELDRPILSRKMKLPCVYIYDTSFTSEEVGLGSGFGVSKEEKTDTYSGDAKQTKFQLSEKAIKPIIGIEIINEAAVQNKHSSGASFSSINNADYDQYSVNYEKNLVTFHSPPPKGKANVIVKYYVPRDVGVVRGLRVKIKFFIDIFGTDHSATNLITEETMKVLVDVTSATYLSSKGIKVGPPTGVNITSLTSAMHGDDRTTSSHENIELSGKRLIYSVETELRTKLLHKRIERIDISRKKEEEM